MKVLVTGGCGFIGTNVVLRLLEEDSIESILVVDKMTYASNDTVKKVMSDDNWRPKGYEKLFFKEYINRSLFYYFKCYFIMFFTYILFI